jgi:hypothetical protein
MVMIPRAKSTSYISQEKRTVAHLAAVARLLLLDSVRRTNAHGRWIGTALLQRTHAVLDLSRHCDESLESLKLMFGE